LTKREDLADFNTIEDFAVETVDDCPDNLKGFEHHFIKIRSALAKGLWSRQFLLGATVLDSLLFQAIKDPTVTDLVEQVLENIVDLGLHRPGFVVYPLHSFGVLYYGAFNVLTGAKARLVLPDPGLAITPQMNDKRKVFDFLSEASNQLDVRHRIPWDLLEHFMRSRPLKWLTNNPLLMMKVRVFSGNYYENQHLLLTRLKFATALMFMLASLSKFSKPDIEGRLLSSSMTNNRETLDIKHYLVFQNPVRRRRDFSIDCIPMNIGRIELAELSDLDIEIDPREWRRRMASFKRVSVALSAMQTGYFQYCIGKRKKNARTLLYSKFMRSLNYFRRSFRAVSSFDNSVVNLTIAFEALLIDSYVPNTKDRLVKRLRTALHGIEGVRAFSKNLRELFETRNQIVHGGATTADIDLAISRRAYGHTFISLMEKLEHRGRPLRLDRPIADLLGE
jgi:hypothetical protein